MASVETLGLGCVSSLQQALLLGAARACDLFYLVHHEHESENDCVSKSSTKLFLALACKL